MRLTTQVLGYPRIGAERELKKACEAYWKGKISADDLEACGREMRKRHWATQRLAGVEVIPSNDFAFYDQVLDTALLVDAVPRRYAPLREAGISSLDLGFAMARGYQKDGHDIIAMEMTKWFDTNYHYLVPEFEKGQVFRLASSKPLDEWTEAMDLGIATKPVFLSPVTFLRLGKVRGEDFDRLSLLDNLTAVYRELLSALWEKGVRCVQFDEPFLCMDLSPSEQEGIRSFYRGVKDDFPGLKVVVVTYFEGLDEHRELACSLPVDVLHIDAVRAPDQPEAVCDLLASSGEKKVLSLGLVDGRNIWKNDFSRSLALIEKAVQKLGEERVWLAPSCSLLHCPFDLEKETGNSALFDEVRIWLAFAKQKLEELTALAHLGGSGLAGEEQAKWQAVLDDNRRALESRSRSALIHRPAVQSRLEAVGEKDKKRKSPFETRFRLQEEELKLPLFPTTTIGSFPQTREVRRLRARFRRGELNAEEYHREIRETIASCVKLQEEMDLDVLVHGEAERNDMVEYFGELLEGFVFSRNGWVQSYGSRGVKPPIIFGDVERKNPMTVDWIRYAQSVTERPMKGMLTGPVTILQWSFVRDDQPRRKTTEQIALAIRDEVQDLEQAGIKIINIDEPAIREGLPLKENRRADYLRWAVEAFRLSSSGVSDKTQIHTHMCYSEFNDMIQNIADMDADVITIETSRSQMELLDIFREFRYPNGIGPGVYDIHSPRVPSVEEMKALLEKALNYIPAERLWVNPDCGLKTRDWPETLEALKNMVQAAKEMRREKA